MVGAADVTNLAQMRAVVREAEKKLGKIHGVIHAAGIAGSTPIGLKTPEELEMAVEHGVGYVVADSFLEIEVLGAVAVHADAELGLVEANAGRRVHDTLDLAVPRLFAQRFHRGHERLDVGTAQGNDDFALARFNPDGSLNPTFGGGGQVMTNFGGGGDMAGLSYKRVSDERSNSFCDLYRYRTCHNKIMERKRKFA